MTTIDKLERVREKILALETREVHVLDGDGEEPWVQYKAIKLNEALAILDAMIAKERADPECYPDGDKCIGCTKPPDGTTCAIHGTVASVAKPAKPDPGDLVFWIHCGEMHARIADPMLLDAFRTVPLKTPAVILMRADEVKRRIEEAGK